jgi:NADH-quinone oxidoreductase subunit F
MPRLKPPFPANMGLYGCPTTVNNVESIAVAPTILRRGGAWFAGLGQAEQHRHQALLRLRATSTSPCNVEEEMGITFRELIDTHCGGMRGRLGQPSVLDPGRLFVPLVPAHEIIDAPMDFDTLRNLKSGLGTAAVMVLRQSTDDGAGRSRASPYFYKHESSGPVHALPARAPAGLWPCISRMAEGRAQKREIDMLLEVSTADRGPHHLRGSATGRGLADPGA